MQRQPASKASVFAGLLSFLFGGKREPIYAHGPTHDLIVSSIRDLSAWDLDRYCGDSLSGRLDPEISVTRAWVYGDRIPLKALPEDAYGFEATAHVAVYDRDSQNQVQDGFDIRCQGIIDAAGDLYFSNIEVLDREVQP